MLCINTMARLTTYVRYKHNIEVIKSNQKKQKDF